MNTLSHTPSRILTPKDFNNPMVIEDIYQIEIELHNKCNLQCPLCSRQNKEIQEYIKTPKEIDFENLKKTLIQFPNLQKVHLVGSLSEPTLYTHFFELVTFLKENNIAIMFSTNASVWNESKWEEFGKLLTSKDEVRFAIDGSDQLKHSRYRKGSKLNKVIENFLAFSDSKAFKVLQTIKFRHNEEIYQDEINKIQEMCHNKFDFVYQLSTNSENINLGLEYPKKDNLKVKLYKRIFKESSKKDFSKLNKEIDCFSKDGFIYINHLGNFITCCDRYEEFLLNKDNIILPNVNNFKVDFLLDFLNGIYKKVPCTDICIKHCHKLVQQIEQDRDILMDKKIKKGSFNV